MNNKVTILKSQKLPYGTAELRSDNILVFRPDVGRTTEVNIAMLKELHTVFTQITDGQPRPYLSDNRCITGIVNREEQAFMTEHFHEFASIAAILTKSPIMRVILNSFNAIFKPKIKIRLFTNEESAVEWLLKNEQG